MVIEPLVSVILPIYNCEKFLKATIDALLKQDYNNFEIIAVDDCSSDNSFNILSSYNNSKIHIYKNEKQMGISYTTNRALSYAKGKYIMQQDHDDISLPNRISLSMKFLEANPKVAGVSCSEKSINEKVLSTNYIDKRDIIIDKDYNIVDCEQFFTGAFRNPTCMFRRDILKNLDIWYDENIKISADMDFFERINAAGFKWATLKNITLLYRKHSNNATKISKNIARDEFEKIVVKSIKRIMPEITEAQLERHLKNALRRGLFSQDEFEKLLDWYKYLITYNKEKKFFDNESWYKVLSKHYMSLVIHSFIRKPFAGYKALFYIDELKPYYKNIKIKYIYEWQKKVTKYWKYFIFGI